MVWKPKKPMSAEAAAVRLEGMCAQAEYCRFELQRKLYQWKVPSAQGERILASLEERRFFSDSRFASVFCRQKAVYARWGRRKIVLALKAKRISQQDIDAALQEIDEDEYMRNMMDLLRSKAASLKEGNTYDGRTKLFRFGAQRGYEPALVAAAIRSGVLWPENEEE